MIKRGIIFYHMMVSVFLVFGFAETRAILPDISQPVGIRVDEHQIYVVDGIKIYIYSKDNITLRKIFGKSGIEPGKFRPDNRGRKRILLDIRADVILVSSYERISFFSKSGEFIRDSETSPQTGFYHQAGENLVASNFYWEKKASQSNEQLLIFGKNLKLKKTFYKTSPQGGRMLRLVPGKKADYRVIKEYFGFKVSGDKIYVADTMKGFFIAVFDLQGNKLYDIKGEYSRLEVTNSDKKSKLEELKEERIWKYRK